jgi:hypothetical protein
MGRYGDILKASLPKATRVEVLKPSSLPTVSLSSSCRHVSLRVEPFGSTQSRSPVRTHQPNLTSVNTICQGILPHSIHKYLFVLSFPSFLTVLPSQPFTATINDENKY